MLRHVLRWAARWFGGVEFTMRSGLAKGMRRRYGPGFKPILRLSPEERLLQSLELSGKTVYDLGGYVGIVALFFSRAVGPGGHVLTFEPNPDNFAELERNLSLNGCRNVQAFPVAVGAARGPGEMVTDPIWPTRGSVETTRKEALGRRSGAERLAIEVVALDGFIAERQLPQPDFVKIDVEGFELEALEGMAATLARCHPELLLEMHGVAGRDVVAFLQARGYRVRHVEADRPVTGPTDPVVRCGHLHCS